MCCVVTTFFSTKRDPHLQMFVPRTPTLPPPPCSLSSPPPRPPQPSPATPSPTPAQPHPPNSLYPCWAKHPPSSPPTQAVSNPSCCVLPQSTHSPAPPSTLRSAKPHAARPAPAASPSPSLAMLTASARLTSYHRRRPHTRRCPSHAHMCVVCGCGFHSGSLSPHNDSPWQRLHLTLIQQDLSHPRVQIRCLEKKVHLCSCIPNLRRLWHTRSGDTLVSTLLFCAPLLCALPWEQESCTSR